MELAKPIKKELDGMEKNIPKEPLIKTKRYKADCKSWQQAYDLKRDEYKVLQGRFNQAKAEQGEIEKNGGCVSKSSAVGLVVKKQPHEYERYGKAIDRINEITQIEQRQSAQRAVDRMNEQKEQRNNKDMG